MRLVCFVSILLFFFSSCSKQQKEKVVKGETGEVKHFHHYDKEFQNLTLSYMGVLRGIDIHDSFEEVKKKESGVLVSEASDRLYYELKPGGGIEGSIAYLFSEGKLSSITLLVSIHDIVEYESMLVEFIDFFSHKYGVPKITDDRDEIWKVKGFDEHEVDILSREVEGDKFEIEIDIS